MKWYKSIWQLLFEDMLITGIGVASMRQRKWYNLLRYIIGKNYMKLVKPSDFWRSK